MPDQKEFYIAGVKFHRMNEVLGKLGVGDNLTLSPEPENKFDPNAVRIQYESLPKLDDGYSDVNSVMLGYVPKKFSSEISAMFEIGLNLECIITELNKTAKPWEMCKVVIREVE